MWEWIAFIGGTATVLLWMSRAQPFPEISARWAWLMICVAILLAIATQGTRQTSPDVAPILSASIGGIGVILGIRSTSIQKRDVLVAPFASLWLTVGTISLLTTDWNEYNQTEQIVGFLLATSTTFLSTFLLWKGLIIGLQGITWSQAALRQLERGLVDGDRGAISMFEKSWDSEQNWLDAMSHAALMKLYAHRGNERKARHHEKRLNRLGGLESVNKAWLKKIDYSIRKLSPPKDEAE
ncbi:MAG: hypothetical protein VX320_03920 [Candidatus Thermoplasmatota archaeon]|nr:hypothetical protein [Candidatus Thermoplasmatota archaeon]